MCSISVAPMPSMIRRPVASLPGVERRPWAASRRRRRICAATRCRGRQLAEHRAVRGRRGEADGGAVASAIAGEQLVRRRLLQQHRGGADTQREQHEAAEPEGEGERRRADEEVVRARLAARAGAIAVADRQHVAVEMHGALRLAGGAGGEGDQADVVARGVARREGARSRLRHQRFEAPRRRRCPK